MIKIKTHQNTPAHKGVISRSSSCSENRGDPGGSCYLTALHVLLQIYYRSIKKIGNKQVGGRTANSLVPLGNFLPRERNRVTQIVNKPAGFQSILLMHIFARPVKTRIFFLKKTFIFFNTSAVATKKINANQSFMCNITRRKSNNSKSKRTCINIVV